MWCCPSKLPSHPRVTTLPSMTVRRVDPIPSLGVTPVGIGATIGTATTAVNTSVNGGGGRRRNGGIRAVMDAAGAAPGATATAVAPAPDD